MSNPFEGRSPSIQGPATDLMPITPDDSTDLAVTAIALYVETGGSLCFDTVSGARRTVEVPDFFLLPVGVARVCATGTTAAGLHAMVLA